MDTFKYIQVPPDGSPIEVAPDGKVQTPAKPIIAFVEGDGTGPDIWRASQLVFDAAVEHCYGGERRIAWMEVFAGEKANQKCGTYLPDETLEAIRQYSVAIKGPLTTPVGEGFRSLNVSLRQKLNLFACVRPVRHFPGVPSPVKEPEKVDMVIFRENTEDVYAGMEVEQGQPETKQLIEYLEKSFGWNIRPDSGIGIKPISITGTKQLVRAALNYAVKHKRKSVTLVHKGNIQKFTEGAFRKWGYEVAAEEFGDVTITEDELWEKYDGQQPEGKIVIKDRIADIMFQLMLLRPAEFEVLATMNLNGDYLSDSLAAEVGGMGIAPGANMADNVAVFEATHGTAPKYAGKDMVNPSSLLFSGCMMFDYIGWPEVTKLIESAFEKVVGEKVVTYDFARQIDNATKVPTSGFADALVDAIRKG